MFQGHVAQKVTSSQLHKRAERVASFITDKVRFNSGDHIALVYPPGEHSSLSGVCVHHLLLVLPMQE